MLTTALVHAASSFAQKTEVDTGLSWAVGGGTFVFLLILLGALVAFGGGREHS